LNFQGLTDYPEFGCVRNAGGRVAQAEGEIAFACAAVDMDDIVIIHHEGITRSTFSLNTDVRYILDCGMQNMTNDIIRKKLAAKGLGNQTSATFDFGEIPECVPLFLPSRPIYSPCLQHGRERPARRRHPSQLCLS
jgi:hypothetical protein